MGGKVLEYEAKTIYKKGLSQGLSQGLSRGEMNGNIKAVRSLMQNMQLTAEKAMEAIGIPKSEFAKYMTML